VERLLLYCFDITSIFTQAGGRDKLAAVLTNLFLPYKRDILLNLACQGNFT
jgi:hypothetical protein